MNLFFFQRGQQQCITFSCSWTQSHRKWWKKIKERKRKNWKALQKSKKMYVTVLHNEEFLAILFFFLVKTEIVSSAMVNSSNNIGHFAHRKIVQKPKSTCAFSHSFHSIPLRSVHSFIHSFNYIYFHLKMNLR